ncbi:MAG: aspartate kinase [Eubacteriales bacterium]|nr:aspartate kinase [Eubacteriales bacterium]
MLIVKKFGGSSVRDAERIKNVADRVIRDYNEGHDIVVVLSAMGDTTDNYIKLAHELNERPSKREMDMLMTTGEQISVALLAMAIQAKRVPAVSLNAFQVGMETTSDFMHARLKRIQTQRLKNELENRKVVIVTGFQGVNRNDDFTTLGRGGSDTTAVALASVLHADLCEIYTDVDGIYTADPRVVPNAKKLDEITYDEMLELASLGAKVLHNRSVEMAKKYGVPLVVRSSLVDAEGTVVKEDVPVEKMLIKGVTCDKNVAKLAVIGLKNEPGVAFKLFNILARYDVNVDIILQSIGRNETKDISFTVAKEYLDDAIDALNDVNAGISFEKIHYDVDVAKVSIVGAGMMTHAGVAAKMFEALYNANVNINMISTSEIKITVLVHADDANRTVKAIHDMFE